MSEEEIQKIFDAAKPAIESTLDKLIEDYEEGRLFSAGQQSAFLKFLLVSLEEPLPSEEDRQWVDEVAEVINNIDAREGCA
jgi:hypothetical protein